jgi:undecaprenyl-diphosphatase
MSLDIAINSFMQTIENPLFTQISKFIDFIFEPMLLIMVGLIISFYLFYKGLKKEGIVFTVSMIIMGGLMQLFKELFMRTRPLNSIISVSGYALPSGHATASIVFLGLIAYLIARNKSLQIKILSYVIAGIVILFTGLSRVYLRVHWMTDVLMGFLLGGIILLVGIIILEKKGL